MKNFIKFISIVIVILFILFFIPLLINVLFKVDFNIWWLESEWSAGDALNFFGSILSFVGTIALGAISIWQTHKANSISEKLLEKDLLESTDFIKLKNKINIDYKKNKDTKLTWSTYHKLDYGANILIEDFDEQIDKFNQYTIKFYFTNSSEKNHIKKIELESFMCVQDPSSNGLRWSDNSDAPIALNLNIEFPKDVYINWVTENEFYTLFKIYCDPRGCFDTMLQNKSNLCMMFQFNIYSLSNVKTQMSYKMWILKGRKNEYEVINTNSTIVNSEIIKN